MFEKNFLFSKTAHMQTKTKNLVLKEQFFRLPRKKKMDYSKLIVPLSVFANTKFDDAKRTLATETKLAGPYYAIESLNTMFAGLLQRREIGLQSDELDDVLHALAKCKLGLIKEAGDLSSSASVGCALVGFSLERCNDGDVGLVFNFGTGGGKVTAFSNNNGQLQTLFDLKPRDVAPNPNQLSCGDYEPKKRKSAADDAAHMQAFCSQIEAMIAELGIKVKWAMVFITGPIRQFYDELNDETKQTNMACAIRMYMWPIADRWPLVRQKSFFLHQETEAEYENKACKALYHAVSRSRTPSCGWEVVQDTSCGIGRGSCQLLFGLMASFGMDALESKQVPTDELFQQMVKHLSDPKSKNERIAFVCDVTRIIASGNVPIIPCKSGFAILVNSDSWLDRFQTSWESASAMQQRARDKRRLEFGQLEHVRLVRAVRDVQRLLQAELDKYDDHDHATHANNNQEFSYDTQFDTVNVYF